MTLPTLFLPHGGGPWPWVPDLMGPGAHEALRTHLQALPSTLPRPRAILCVTAHWEAAQPTVSRAAHPGMLYDYRGFPAHTYQVTWPAPGDPALADRVRVLLDTAGIDNAADDTRGFDHGTFVPLSVAWPEADIPVVQLSLVQGLDPVLHLAIGRALAPLRDEGVLLVGSGMSYHHMRGFGTAQGRRDAQVFDDWLAEAVTDPHRRDDALVRWSSAPAGRASHPREEHLLPLMVVAGASVGHPASLPFRDKVLGVRVSTVRFDAPRG